MATESSGFTVDSTTKKTILRSAVGIGLYGGALGVSYGAVAGGAGLSIWQTMLMSLIMFSGGSQFAFVGALASPWAAMAVALLLALRNSFYGVRLAKILQPLGWKRLFSAHLVIDESTAMSIGQTTREASRYAFYATGIAMFTLWQLGSIIGVLVGRGIDTQAFGLDVAAPAAFIALLWPGLKARRAQIVGAIAAGLAFLLIPIAPAGVPVLLTAFIAIFAGWPTPAPQNVSPVGQDEQ